MPDYASASHGTSTTAQDASVDAALDARNVSKTFVQTKVLCDVDLRIAAGEIHALLGENGSGKSTLIKILSGYHQPDPGGDVLIGGRRLDFGSPTSSYALGCRVVHQDLALVDACSVADNLFMSARFPSALGTIRASATRRQAVKDLERVGLDIDPRTQVAELSPSMKTGVAVARALREDDENRAKLLILDEPTATLPENEVERLLATVRTVASKGIGVLYVTHRLDEIFRLARNISVLRDGRKVGGRAVGSLTHAELIDLLVGKELEEVRVASNALTIAPDSAVLEVERLVAIPIVNASFSVYPGEIVGVAGITGSGRETLLSSIFGASERDSGVVRINGTDVQPMRPHKAVDLGLAFMPADRKTLGGIMSLSARENLTLVDLDTYWSAPLLHSREERGAAKTWLETLGVRPAGRQEALLSTFSGGNQQKILFGKWLLKRPRVMLLDEPTQGVDVGAKADLHRQLIGAAQAGMGIIISSADVDELVALCHRILVMRRGNVVSELRGEEATVSGVSSAMLGES